MAKPRLTHYVRIENGDAWHKVSARFISELFSVYGQRLSMRWNPETRQCYHFVDSLTENSFHEGLEVWPNV